MYRLNSKDFLNFKATKEIKINDYLKERGVSSRLIRKSVKSENIYLNGKLIKKNKKLKLNDIISLKFQDEDPNGKIENKNLDILYEDDDLIIINKEPFMVTHTAKDDSEGTLLNYLLGYFHDNNIKRKVRFINRLDRDTSGIVVASKNSFAQDKISAEFRDVVEKKYLAICQGIFDEKEGTIDAPIATSEDNIRREVNYVIGKKSITSYKVIEEYENMSLVLLSLHTGRTHQIRVHLSHLGHPIIGDSLYGEKSDLINRQALHSYSIKLKLPRNNKEIEIFAKLPKDFHFFPTLY
ncbi:RluA family pseudouridine synthase [uncultured Peptoniphilus sp.]|uniref:RluA family pseudouridine synthase n=1 Tax=uncultured Peptoniphilus sp. TaxID=254354 RepID=UPI0025906AF6|nr:RluA family pseudouridine synthase [uncultured Peptoniphilus sp.]MDU6783543.1 RluA family pseudouridine synthase [Peptoniphilus harei]